MSPENKSIDLLKKGTVNAVWIPVPESSLHAGTVFDTSHDLFSTVLVEMIENLKFENE
jgi:hypothetical protein